MCLPRALVVAKAHAEKDPEYKAILQDRCNRQTLKARKLLNRARVVIPEEGAGIPELQRLQDCLRDYNIVVYNYNTRGREVYFDGGRQNSKFKLNLLYHQGHFNVITSLTSAFVTSYYCEACHVPYNNRSDHRCSNICPYCQYTSPPCELVDGGVACGDCNLTLRNQTCFEAHKRGRCNAVKKCLSCDRLVNLSKRKSQHVCGEVYCKICQTFMPPNHQCFMRVDTGKPVTKDFAFIFFDLEARQDQNLNSASNAKVHQPNLCVSQQFCWQCIGDGEASCQNCTPRTQVFSGDQVIDHFMVYVMEVSQKFKKVCVMAHNGQGYDFQFLRKYVLEQTKFTP